MRFAGVYFCAHLNAKWMKVVIVDDEWYGLDVTYRLLTQIRLDLEVVAFFQHPKEALEKIPLLKRI
jgi:two-component SAPR family response regulator